MSSAESTPAPLADALQAQYELLRAAALGEAAAPQARSGLTVLLRQGMWSWARVFARGNTPQEAIAPFAPQSPRSEQPCERRAVIHLLAAMAMTISDRRTA